MMTDTREKLIRLLEQGIFYAEKTNADNNIKFTCSAVVDWLMAQGVTIQEWIPVSERLPEDLPENKGKKVIKCIVAHCLYNNGKLTSQFRERKYDKYSDKWYWSKIGGCTVTHWMPLPEPPKED